MSYGSSEAIAFGEYLKESAVKNKIWLNLCGHFSSPDVQYKYPPDDYLQKGYIPFEITDSENSSEANQILSDILYDENLRQENLSRDDLVCHNYLLINKTAQKRPIKVSFALYAYILNLDTKSM